MALHWPLIIETSRLGGVAFPGQIWREIDELVMPFSQKPESHAHERGSEDSGRSVSWSVALSQSCPGGPSGSAATLSPPLSMTRLGCDSTEAPVQARWRRGHALPQVHICRQEGRARECSLWCEWSCLSPGALPDASRPSVYSPWAVQAECL